MEIQIKRVYKASSSEDGYRILVDRIWPRGVSKEKANLKGWEKEIAPSTSLRKWFGHDPKKYEDFKKKYQEELKAHSQEIQKIKSQAEKQKVTLVYGAKDEEHNQAVVLKEWIEKE